MDLFDIIGPVMVGPSSSHTARNASSSAVVYTPPTSVVLLTYTRRGFTMCSSG